MIIGDKNGIAVPAMKPKRKQVCANCHFREEGQGAHLCKFNPPLPIVQNVRGALGQSGLQIMAVWPPALDDGWCGQWRSSLAGFVAVVAQNLEPVNVPPYAAFNDAPSDEPKQ